MADPQPFYRWAWVLEIIGPATIRRATTDLPEPAAVATLGDFYKKGIKSIDTRIVDALPSLFYGVRRRSGFECTVYTEGDMDPAAEWRGAPFTLWHYDRELNVRTVDMTGLVTNAQFANGQCVLTLDTVDTGILQDLLPAATINPKAGSPFEQSGTGAGLPLPVVFGNDVLILPPPISVNTTGDGELSTYDYALGFGDNIRLSDAWAELDTGRAGLERLHNFVTAPGSPAYLSGELDPDRRATRFRVTGNQSVRYSSGMPIRLNVTTSPTTPLYSAVRAYDSSVTPNQVEIYDNFIDSGIANVEIAGDFAVVRDVYTTVTEGILPVPVEGQSLTALRLFGNEDSVTALVSNPTYPSGTGGSLPSQIIRAIITNPVWGMSSRVQQQVDDTSFDTATLILGLVGLGGTIQGGLGIDGKQYPAEQVLDALCMIARGGRLAKNASGKWTLAVDTITSSVASFVFGPGAESGARIKKVISYGRAPLDQAVRNLVLHWSPLGRAQARRVVRAPEGYARYSTKAVSGLGQDRHLYNPFIRNTDAAERVLQYLAEMLKGADEQLVFTAGPEARDRQVGEVITAISTVDGFSGDWKIVEVSKSLADVQLSCIRQRDQAYDSPSGIEHSAEPSDDVNVRTTPESGPNLITNPEPAPPLRRSVAQAPLFPEGFPIAYGPGTVFQIPDGWKLQESDAGHLSEFTYDASEAIRSRSVGGHYCRMVWTAVDPSPPVLIHGDGIFSDSFAVKHVGDHFISFYGDADDGWYLSVVEDNDPSFWATNPTLIRDDTDTDSNGWTRFYARWKPQPDTKRAVIGIMVSKPGTYQWAGVKVNAISGSGRKPTDWSRDVHSPPVLTRISAEVELDGSTEYRVPLIEAGDYAVGATLRVTGALTFGTAVKFAVGTDNDPEVWARNIRDPFAETTSRNFKAGSVAAFFAEDSDVVVSFQQADGTPGTATSGKFRLTYSYTRSFPTPGL